MQRYCVERKVAITDSEETAVLKSVQNTVLDNKVHTASRTLVRQAERLSKRADCKELPVLLQQVAGGDEGPRDESRESRLRGSGHEIALFGQKLLQSAMAHRPGRTKKTGNEPSDDQDDI